MLTNSKYIITVNIPLDNTDGNEITASNNYFSLFIKFVCYYLLVFSFSIHPF